MIPDFTSTDEAEAFGKSMSFADIQLLYQRREWYIVQSRWAYQASHDFDLAIVYATKAQFDREAIQVVVPFDKAHDAIRMLILWSISDMPYNELWHDLE